MIWGASGFEEKMAKVSTPRVLFSGLGEDKIVVWVQIPLKETCQLPLHLPPEILLVPSMLDFCSLYCCL